MDLISNTESTLDAFIELLRLTVDELNEHARKSPASIAELKGPKLEPYVRDVMNKLAVNTPFENSIELIGGQKFPDIVVGKHFGIEVKTTTQNHWKTTGNSVLESTRVADVERIFMLFGKLGEPIEFRFRAYEECLSEVVVTHSPRYLIDMNLGMGQTIFTKIGQSYDTLRQKKNPIKPVTDYYKSKLKPGQELWWIDQDQEKASNLVIDLWKNIEAQRRHEITSQAMVYFPEIFSNRGDKFTRFAVWLVTSEAIVCPNIRDLFTAGGKANYKIGKDEYQDVPRIFINLLDQIASVLEVLKNTSAEELGTYWKTETTEKDKRSDWMNRVSVHASSVSGAKHLDIQEMLALVLN